MAELTKFEYVNSSVEANLTKVEVTLDGGKTYGLLWSNVAKLPSNLTLSQDTNFSDSMSGMVEGLVGNAGSIFKVTYDGNKRNVTYTLSESEYSGRIVDYSIINYNDKSVIVGIDFTGKEDLPIVITATIEGTDTYMEETVSISVTVPGAYGRDEVSSRYELIPIDSNGEPCNSFNFEIPDTNNDYGFIINYNLVHYYTINGNSGSEIIQSGSKPIGPYSSPGTYYVDISDSYDGEWYTVEVQVNITIDQPPIATNGWYIRDPYTSDISTNHASQCYDVTVSFEVYDHVEDSYFISTNNFEVPFGYEQSGYTVNLSYTELYYDASTGTDKEYTVTYPDIYTIFIN